MSHLLCLYFDLCVTVLCVVRYRYFLYFFPYASFFSGILFLFYFFCSLGIVIRVVSCDLLSIYLIM